jgi:hypothetical protein
MSETKIKSSPLPTPSDGCEGQVLTPFRPSGTTAMGKASDELSPGDSRRSLQPRARSGNGGAAWGIRAHQQKSRRRGGALDAIKCR